MDKSENSGKISEWNEGNLKSKRLHDAQEIINFSKMGLLSKSINNTDWNYQLWITAIDNLYGEGCAKYGNAEIEEIDKIKELIRLTLKHRPPHSFQSDDSMSGRKHKFVLNTNNWEILRKMGVLFEFKVKQYNDSHGLSTRNREDDDFGL